jgi:putative intracellular protease/amidase
MFEAGKVVAAVCHGPCALCNVKLSDGSYLVAGKEVSAFSNAEEDGVQVPELLLTNS